MRGAEGVHVVVDHAGGWWGIGGAQEVQPGVREGDDGGGDGVGGHEGQFGGEGGVGGVQGAAAKVRGEVRGIV